MQIRVFWGDHGATEVNIAGIEAFEGRHTIPKETFSLVSQEVTIGVTRSRV